MFTASKAKPASQLRNLITKPLLHDLSEIVLNYYLPSAGTILNMLAQPEETGAASALDTFLPCIVDDQLAEWKSSAPLIYLYYLPINKWTEEDVMLAASSTSNQMSEHKSLKQLIQIKSLFKQKKQNDALAMIDAWQNSDIPMCNVNLSGVEMTGPARYVRTFPIENMVYFSRFRLKNAKLEKIDLSFAYVVRADLSEANLRSSILREANFSHSNMTLSWFDKSNMRASRFYRSNFNCASLIDVDLTNSVFESANLSNANLTGANLTYADMRKANLYGAKFRNTILSNANLTDAILSYANFDNAVMRSVNFQDSDLCGADLRKSTDLEKSNFLSLKNLSSVSPEFQPLIEYFKRCDRPSVWTIWNKYIDLNELVQAFWLTGAKDLTEFERRYREIPNNLLKIGNYFETSFCKALQKVRDNFVALKPVNIVLKK